LTKIGENSGGAGGPPSDSRAWITLADAGKVRIFRTPGGHRRFSQNDLHTLTGAAAPDAAHPRVSLGDLALVRIRRRLKRPR
jgi:hypothetical protein